jgi:hypothetical protein
MKRIPKHIGIIQMVTGGGLLKEDYRRKLVIVQDWLQD